jgi:MYXO-CTERM domain-containing protein
VDDRIFATALGQDSVSISWLDTADYGGGPFTLDLSAAQVRTILAAEVSGEQVLYVGGSQLDVLRWDTSVIPALAPASDAAVGLGIDGGMLVALDWDGDSHSLYALDSQNAQLHHLDFTDPTEPGLDSLSESWPLQLGGELTDMVRFDATTLLLVGNYEGQPFIGMVDLTVPEEPAVYSVAVGHFAGGSAVAVAANGEDTAWVLYSSGDLWSLKVASGGGPPGDDDDSAPGDDGPRGSDDDDSAGDDDDSAGDDDDSAGDDDDSAGDDDDSAGGELVPPDSGIDWVYDFVANDPGGQALDLSHRSHDGVAYLSTVAASQVQVRSEAGLLISSFALDGAAGGLAASSFIDGALYASVPSMDQVELITAAPFITLESAEPTYLPEASDELVVTFTVWMGADETDVCDYSLAIDGDITGGGTPIEGVEGQATHGAEIVETLTGEDLASGVHRLWIYCADDDGDLGRISFAYEYSGLAAPSGFALDPGDGEVVVSWTHDGSSAGYRLRFSDSSFAASEDPTFCNADNSFCSAYELSVDGAGDDDDSSGASDDDDSAGDSLAAGETLSVTIGGLVNGTRHYFALVALDSSDSEGPSTDVLYATPNVLGGAAAQAGDIGGCACNSSSPTGAPLAAFLLLGLFLRSLRRTQGPHR